MGMTMSGDVTQVPGSGGRLQKTSTAGFEAPVPPGHKPMLGTGTYWRFSAGVKRPTAAVASLES